MGAVPLPVSENRLEHIGRARGIPIAVIFNTTVCRDNFDEIPDMARAGPEGGAALADPPVLHGRFSEEGVVAHRLRQQTPPGQDPGWMEGPSSFLMTGD